MNKKIFIGSIIVVFMLMFLPITSSIQTNQEINENFQLKDFKDLQNMDLDYLTDFLIDIILENPEISDDIINQKEEFEKDYILNNDIEDDDSNQTFLEKIWLRVFNYRLFRLYLIFWITIYFQSKITLLRTIHWSMKVLRWVKIGIILGVINLPDYEPSETPEISFEMDIENNTLIVEYVYPDDVLWDDIDQIGSGNCDPFPNGYIMVGNEITNCLGMIVLRYIPTNEVIGVFEF